MARPERFLDRWPDQGARGSIRARWSNQNGSGTVLALSVVFVSVACLGVSQIVALQLLTQVRLNAVADAAALAADDALRGLTTGFPCEIAGAIAQENMANLNECRIVGFEAFVNLRVQSMGIVLNASARAGPSS
jgi:secretion/DNA translocation related TadE-like protein